MADIIAEKIVKGKSVKQRFNAHAWDLLGPDKNGWKESKDQTISNSVGTSGASQVIENDIVKKEKAPAPPPIVKDPVVKDDSKRAEFMKHIEGFNKGTIKDHFDNITPKVEYSNRANLTTLKNQLADLYKNDVVELQKAFI